MSLNYLTNLILDNHWIWKLVALRVCLHGNKRKNLPQIHIYVIQVELLISVPTKLFRAPAVFPDFRKASTKEWWLEEIDKFHDRVEFDGLWIVS